jgi:putative ABC transport system permease protein
MVAVVLNLDGDLFITNRGRYMVSQPVPFPRGRLELAEGAPGVAQAHPFYLLTEEEALWRNPLTGLSRPIRLLAYDPQADLLLLDAVRRQRILWSRPDTVLADDRSKPLLFGELRPGTVSEFNNRRVEVVGNFSMGTDFRSNGTIVMSELNALRYCPQRAALPWSLTPVDIGVVRLVAGTPLSAAREAVAARLPADVIVLTKAELVRKEQDFWEKVTPIGVVFDIGMAMGFVVGLAICYQVLFAEIADRLPRFGDSGGAADPALNQHSRAELLVRRGGQQGAGTDRNRPRNRSRRGGHPDWSVGLRQDDALDGHRRLAARRARKGARARP